MKKADHREFGVRIVGFESDLEESIRWVFRRTGSHDWSAMEQLPVLSHDAANTLWIVKIDQARVPRTEQLRGFLHHTRHSSPIFLLSEGMDQRSTSQALLREWLDLSGARVFEGRNGRDRLLRFLVGTAERKPGEIIVNARFSDDGLHVRFGDNVRAVVPFRSLRRIAEEDDIHWDSLRIAGERTFITLTAGGGAEIPVPHDVLREFAVCKAPERKAASLRERKLTARSFGAKLRATREHHGITQEALAAKVGSSRWSILRIEKGDYLPKVALLQNFARALDVQVEELLASH